jgi:hypothetical protein
MKILRRLALEPLEAGHVPLDEARLLRVDGASDVREANKLCVVRVIGDPRPCTSWLNCLCSGKTLECLADHQRMYQ